jgi:uncharacterized protein DUF3365
MKPKYIFLVLGYLALVVTMAWFTRSKAVDFARKEGQRQAEYQEGGLAPPATPVLSSMAGIFNPNSKGDPGAAAAVLAQRATREIIQRLGSRLQAAMAEGGPLQAISICKEVAQEVTQEYSSEQGFVVRRTALRWRNPLNKPDAFESEWMNRVQNSTAAQAAPNFNEIIEDQQGLATELRQLTPLYLKPLCLSCHGDSTQISPQVQEILNRDYPDDLAFGFKDGEFRGAVSVRIPLSLVAGGEINSQPDGAK